MQVTPSLDIVASRAARHQRLQDRFRTRSGIPIPDNKNNKNGGQNALFAVLSALDVTKVSRKQARVKDVKSIAGMSMFQAARER